MEFILWFVLATLALSTLCIFNILTQRSASGRQRPPGPRPLPLIGNLLQLSGHLHHRLAHLARSHGPIMCLELGFTTTVVVSSRDAAKEAFMKHDKHLAARNIPDAVRALGWSERSMVWLPSSDPLCKTLRGIVATHLFSPRSLAASRSVRELKVRELARYLRGRAGQEVDIGKTLYSSMLNLVSRVFFSVDVVDMDGESAQGIRELVREIGILMTKPNISDLFPVLRPLDLQGCRRSAVGLMEKVFVVMDGILERRRIADSPSVKHNDFLDVLLDLISTGKIAREIAITLMFDLFIAGSDTIALTVEWAMAELLRNPRIMAKLRAELRGALGGKETIEESDAVRLPYLQAVVKEAMRLHPVAPVMVPHQATEDAVEIGGYAVPKGSTVIFNTWAIMRDPAVWYRPDDFMPERFMDRAQEVDLRGKDFEFIPFGTGRRQCPGLLMAERVVPLVMASMLHAFEWQLPGGMSMSAEELDVTERFATSNVLATPLKAVPIVLT